MEEEIKSIIDVLKFASEENHRQGSNLSGTSDSLSEWYFGNSEGLETAIKMLEGLFD